MANYATKQQQTENIRKEFVRITKEKKRNTITHDEIVEIARKLGLSSESNELEGLIYDADVNLNDSIEMDEYLIIMEQLSSKQFSDKDILDLPDEVEMAKRLTNFNKKVMDLVKKDPGGAVSNEVLRQLCIDCGIPIEDQSESMH